MHLPRRGGEGAERRRPLDRAYAGASILTNPPPSAGGLLIAFALDLLSDAGLDSLPAFGLPEASASVAGNLVVTAFVITLVGFMESIAVAKVYARRYRYDLQPNSELIGLGAANVASGMFGGYPVTGGFSRTAVNDTAGAKTPFASIITALIVLSTIAFLTPLFTSLPKAALGAIIVMAIIGLIDVKEMRHIAAVKKSDLIGLGVAFVATLALGICTCQLSRIEISANVEGSVKMFADELEVR